MLPQDHGGRSFPVRHRLAAAGPAQAKRAEDDGSDRHDRGAARTGHGRQCGEAVEIELNADAGREGGIMLTIARILLSLTALGYGLATIKADFNKTHATNPLWTPHARFHVVWQILSYSGIGLIALYLIWAPGPMEAERLYLAVAF